MAQIPPPIQSKAVHPGLLLGRIRSSQGRIRSSLGRIRSSQGRTSSRRLRHRV